MHALCYCTVRENGLIWKYSFTTTATIRLCEKKMRLDDFTIYYFVLPISYRPTEILFFREERNYKYNNISKDNRRLSLVKEYDLLFITSTLLGWIQTQAFHVSICLLLQSVRSYSKATYCTCCYGLVHIERRFKKPTQPCHHHTYPIRRFHVSAELLLLRKIPTYLPS